MGKETKYSRFLESRGIKSKDVVEATGMNKSQVSLVKNGYQNITMKTLQKLVIYHRCSPGEFLEWEKWIEEADKKKAEKAAKQKPGQ